MAHAAHEVMRAQLSRMVEPGGRDQLCQRNVVPKVIEDMLKKHQLAAWENQI